MNKADIQEINVLLKEFQKEGYIDLFYEAAHRLNQLYRLALRTEKDEFPLTKFLLYEVTKTEEGEIWKFVEKTPFDQKEEIHFLMDDKELIPVPLRHEIVNGKEVETEVNTCEEAVIKRRGKTNEK